MVVEPNFDITAPLVGSSGQMTTFKPTIGNHERNMRYKKWKMAVERCMNWDTSTLTESSKLDF